jgi:hypothetical protein
MAEFFWRNFLGGLFWEDYLEDFLGGILCTTCATCLSRFCLNGEGRKDKNLDP